MNAMKVTAKDYESKIGKYIICETKHDNDTRLFIHHFSKDETAIPKNGYKDIFTITNEKCPKEFYLKKIDEVKTCRSGYPLFYSFKWRLYW
jgi:hypothetical protein